VATATDDPSAAPFARAAARSAATGAALARTARAESSRVRAALTDAAEARAQRAGVLIAAPLGLCFLPAFLVLGVVPVVIGLAGEVLPQW
jgi:pilus assembly protein TadC